MVLIVPRSEISNLNSIQSHPCADLFRTLRRSYQTLSFDIILQNPETFKSFFQKQCISTHPCRTIPSCRKIFILDNFSEQAKKLGATSNKQSYFLLMIYKDKWQIPIGLESSLKFDSWRIFALCEKLRSSSRNVGSPSLRVLWITISVFNATCMATFIKKKMAKSRENKQNKRLKIEQDET